MEFLGEYNMEEQGYVTARRELLRHREIIRKLKEEIKQEKEKKNGTN
jgi:hypothetical protein